MCERQYGRGRTDAAPRRVILTERKNEAAVRTRYGGPEGNHANLLQWGKIGNSVLRRHGVTR